MLKLIKKLATSFVVALQLVAVHAHGAPIDSNYYVVDATNKSRFEVYNDGKNTYVEAIPGLIIRGATADGQRYIVNGVPTQIAAQLNGKQITVMRGFPPPPEKPEIDTKALQSRIDELSLLLGEADAKLGGPAGDSQRPLSADTTDSKKKESAQMQMRWEVRATDVRLAATFERWAKEAATEGKGGEYRILWDADTHVLIDGTPTYYGSLTDAIEAALKTPGIRNGRNPLEACVYDNAPPVIRITKLGEQSEACPEYN
jgi:hypothetical protein